MWAHCERRQRDQTVIVLTFDNLHTACPKLSKSPLIVKTEHPVQCDLLGIQNKHLWSHEADKEKF